VRRDEAPSRQGCEAGRRRCEAGLPGYAALALLFFLGLPSVAFGQNGPLPPTLVPTGVAVPQDSATARLGQGWNLLGSGRAVEALTIVDEVNAAHPGLHETLRLGVAAELALGRPDLALDKYEKWIKPNTPEDVYLLADIAQGVLVTLSGLNEPNVRVEAAAMLKKAGVDLGPNGPLATPGDVTDIALARVGDAAAIGRLSLSLQKLAGSQAMGAMDALAAGGGARAAMALRGMLSSTDPMMRASAATGLGKMKSQADLTALRQLANDPMSFVAFSAGLALARLGDAEGIRRAEAMLDSGPSDAKVAAAQALGPEQAATWAPKLAALMNDENLLVRVQAAQMLSKVGVNAEVTAPVIGAALASPNPVLRQQATIAVAEGAMATPAQLRFFLHDPDARVRLETAKALLRMVGR
jgi:HEAT repeats